MSRLEYVRQSWRNRDYIRRRPYIRALPTLRQRISRARFGTVAHEKAIDKFGVVELEDGRKMTSGAAAISEELTGKKVKVKVPVPVEVLAEVLAEAHGAIPTPPSGVEETIAEALAEAVERPPGATSTRSRQLS